MTNKELKQLIKELEMERQEVEQRLTIAKSVLLLRKGK